MKKLFSLMAHSFFLCAWLLPLGGESFEFVDRDIGEILYSISLFKGIPISHDDTVSGKTDFRSTGDDFDDTFDAFLKSARLYVEKSEYRWTVSRIKIVQGENGLYSLDGYDVTPFQLFEKMAVKSGLCVTYESLPSVKVSIHTGMCDCEEIFRRIAGLCAGFELKKENPTRYHVARVSSRSLDGAVGVKIDIFIEENGGKELFRCNIQNAPLSLVCEKLSALAGKEFCFSAQTDTKILRASFAGKDFDRTLQTLCAQANAECVLSDGIYYIVPSKNKRLMGEKGKSWRECCLKHLSTSAFLSLCARRFPEIETISVNEGGKFLYLSDDEKSAELLAFVAQSDVRNESHLVQLKYVRTKDFLANLPPFVNKSEITDSGRGDSFYFTGTDAAYEHLLCRMDEFDRPVSRVSYDVLIMQYQTTDGSEWRPNFRIDRMKLGDRTAVSTTVGSVLDLNLDVVGVFGLNFAAELQAAITGNKAKVFADTTLNGVSGSTINFQNTNTYRYRDNNLDPETGEPIYSGVTKEIVSGLKLEVTGIVTGDGMITSKITASVSRQGTDLSSKTGNPPPSSEKVITTEVRAKSGEPVILSGLIQNEETEAVSRTPILSRIPLLGNLFKAKSKSSEKTELVIYLVPSAEIFGQSDGADDFLPHARQLVREFVGS